jgi:outer membrane immunogenic protein
MRTIITAAVSFGLIGGVAVAADMPPPRPGPSYVPTLVEAPTWTGFYAGINGGGGIGEANSDFSAGASLPFASVDLTLKGAIGGGQIGYNWQSGAAVFGLEADFQAASLKGDISTPCIAPFCGLPLTASYTQEIPWFGTARGRLGYTQSGWMLYATGGFAYGRVETTAVATAGGLTATAASHRDASGWTAGGGAEVLLAPRWSAKVEYLYVDVGRTTNSYILPGGLPTLNDSTRVNFSTVRAGLNYRF